MFNIKTKLMDKYLDKMNSIQTRMYFSYIVIVFFLLIPTVLIGFNSITTSSKYNKIIYNINYASLLTTFIEDKVDKEYWEIVIGKKSFEETNPFDTIKNIDDQLDFLASNASSVKNQETIHVIKRTNNTLEMYTKLFKEQIDNNVSVSERIKTVENALSVSSGIKEFILDFTMAEIQNASLVNEELQNSQRQITIFAAALFIFTSLFAVFTVTSLTNSIKKPLSKLETFAAEVAQGNFKYKAEPPLLFELRGLTESLNIMAIKLEKFIKDRIDYQKNLKKSELQILQAQITPHFLYNTLDTIIWLAEDEKHKEVISVTRALSDFFRVSLSKGSDWITVEQEFKHAKSYLTIQKIRYRDILQYEIIEDDTMKNQGLLKLILQPLIENALYHGIKETRKGGNIKVVGRREDEYMYFEVFDDGVGIEAETLDIISENFKKTADKIKNNYGLYNVNQRLVLYYGEEYKLNIESTPGIGTKVYFRVPLKAANGD